MLAKRCDMQLSNVIGKPVLSPAGEEYGYVIAARLTRDLGAIACLVCADGDEEEFVLPAAAVRSYGDAVIAGGRRLNVPAGIPSPIGKCAYTASGALLGAVVDVNLRGAEGAVLIIEGEHALTQTPVSRVALGRNAIVYPDGIPVPAPKPARKPSGRSKTKKEAPMSEDKVQKSELAAAETKTAKPVRIELLNGTNLLGRKVRVSLSDERGMPVATAGERITPAVLARARRANCLVRLAVATLTEA